LVVRHTGVGGLPTSPGKITRTDFASSDPAELREVIDRGFGSRLQLGVPRRNGWRATVSQLDAGRFTLTETALPAELTFTNDGQDDSFVINTLLEGDVSIDRGKTVSRYGPGDTFLGTGPGCHCAIQSCDVRVQAIALPRSLLTGVAAGAANPSGPSWGFSSPDPVSDGAERWRSTARYVGGLLTSPGVAATPLIIGSAARLLAATALATFPNNALVGPDATDGHDGHPDTVRRAIAFIEENANTDITIGDIAAAAFVTIRAVQLAFRRHLDTTPMAYLRRVRLDHAHAQLMAADPARETVTAVAYRWGFSNASRFAARYHQAYGVTPSDTLHQH
jgi:AraC-like DNA-binding protein